MIHAYDEYYLPIIQDKLATMYDLAINYEKIDIETFTNLFLNSKISKAFEQANPIYVLGKSANELLAIILNKDPINVDMDINRTPEYWVGWVLSYTSWYLNIPYKILLSAIPINKLILYYFPYHELDISRIVDLFKNKIKIYSILKTLRKEKKLSQNDLAILSGVPIRNIQAYEQGSIDISSARADSLYNLAKVLDCSIEKLICEKEYLVK